MLQLPIILRKYENIIVCLLFIYQLVLGIYSKIEYSTEEMFLTPRDLKVGNYVNHDNTTHVVDEIHTKKIVHHWIDSKSDETITTYKEILSIPLSVREIEHLGFMEDGNRIRNVDEAYFDNKGYFIENDAGTYWLCQHHDEDDYQRVAPIDFVHELQNLYFDLTKRVLTYS